MRTLVVSEWMSLDGVVQAPSYPGEDADGGFEHGGWHSRYFDDISKNWVVEGLSRAGAYLFGRRTYESFVSYWPTAPEEDQALAQPLNTRPKYVVSATLNEPLPWQHSTILKGELIEAIAALLREPGGDVHVIGSTQLVRTLIEYRLAGEFRLMIDPVIVGGGKRIFPHDGDLKSLRLADHQVTTTGAILATYVRER